MIDFPLSAAERERLAGQPLPDLVTAVRSDQSLRWRSGQPRPVEAYFDAFAELRGDAGAALIVIGGEVALRLETGRAVSAEELVERFPEYGDELPLLIEVQRTLFDNDEAAPDGLPVVPGYAIEEELGRGAFGIVYRARQLSVGRAVALKVLVSGSLAGEAELARFRSEATVLGRLRHENIVQVFDVGEARVPGGGTVPFIALELIDGPTMAAWAGGRPIAVGTAAELCESLAATMGAAHQAGVVHRALKPANILIADCRLQIADFRPDQPTVSAIRPFATGSLQSAIPKIADFGVAKLLDGGGSATATGAILGTPAYMAPEQAAGHREVGPAADVFALGSILYELLTGSPPFRGESAIADTSTSP